MQTIFIGSSYELSILQYLFSDPQAHPFIDLGDKNEDGVGLVSLTIHGFGAESERDVEREEFARQLTRVEKMDGNHCTMLLFFLLLLCSPIS
ncbi:hypothetical protein BT96DRAFT_1010545 [Gymnopus androsaceus JB14]|uniref:Uncharacterized protein n=1 Tax=Gymnopus androsaceus JB14 TaxID=1447944 RepID=A0A6A4GAI6_9AGAR|nr:hypothetical protein BT96DRAFT_1010545 [Gymnopus androsaceus JB14]